MGSLYCIPTYGLRKKQILRWFDLTFCNSYALPRANLIYTSLHAVGPIF